jgi:hypothetical protein
MTADLATPQQLIAPYLGLLSDWFGDVADFVDVSAHSSDSAANAIMANPKLADDFTNRIIPRLLEASRSYWVAAEAETLQAIRRLPGMKATFGGDVGPQRVFRQLERGGLYFDTILVQDPILRAMRIPQMAHSARTRLAIKYALELVWHTPLYLSGVSPPIAVLIPDREIGTTRQLFDQRWEETEPWATLYWSQLLGRKFKGYAEIVELATGMRSSREMLDAIKRPDLFRMNADADLDPYSQWEGLMELGEDFAPRSPREVDSALGVLDMLRGRLMMANDILNTAYTFDAHPLIGAPLSYHYTLWRGRAIQDEVADALGTHVKADLVETNALLGGGLSWLGNVTNRQLLVLREKGRLEEMRSLFRGAADGLRQIAIGDVEVVSREMDHRISQGLRRHEEEINFKDQAYRDELSIKTGSLLLSAVGAMTPLVWAVPPAWLAAMGIMGAAKLADVIDVVVKQSRETNKIKSTPMAILLDMKRNAEVEKVAATTLPPIFIQPMPDFEWEPEKIDGLAYMIPRELDARVPMAIGPAFTDAVFAAKLFRLIRSWNSGEDRDTEDNVKLSFVMEAEQSYSMILYPSMDRREVGEWFEQIDNQDEEQLVAHWVFYKRFNLASFHGLSLFAERHTEGQEFVFGAFSWHGDEGGAVERLTAIRPLLKRHFRILKREELRPNQVEYWTGGDPRK